MELFSDARALLRGIRPEHPVHGFRPDVARQAARGFVDRFPGEVFFAVKANPQPLCLQALWEGGVRRFDVASLAEVRACARQFPDAELAFMHPVKSRLAIREAWALGVRTFSLDHISELDKIFAEVPDAGQLCLIVRLSVADGDAGVCLAGKFGAAGQDAAALLFACRQIADRVGVSFHVGSQAMRLGAYRDAMRVASEVICEAGVVVDVVDVGGGFPGVYPGMPAPPLGLWFDEIAAAFEEMAVTESCRLWAEPGRILCAEAGSLLVRVEARRGGRLHLNDGTYGGLFDAGRALRFRYPARLLRDSVAPAAPFEFFGPTCDGLDHMPGPFHVPEDVQEGDWIEIGMLGAYSQALRTDFNGFGEHGKALLADEPPHTLSHRAVTLLEQT